MTSAPTPDTDPFCQGCTHTQRTPSDATGIKMLALGWHRCGLQASEHFFGRFARCNLAPLRYHPVSPPSGVEP